MTTTQGLTLGYLPIALTEPEGSGEVDVDPVLRYFRAVARARGGALSVPVAWNCLAFGYDLGARQYTSDLIDPNALPAVTIDEVTSPLPTGALVALRTGAGAVAAEVVHREGAHAQLADDGTAPGWLSGAPAGSDDPARDLGFSQEPVGSSSGTVLVDELLTLDAFALGTDRPQRLRRLNGRWLDPLGHLHVRTRYRNAELAEQSEVQQYVTYLVETRAELAVELLERAGARPDGSEWTVGQLTSRLQTSLLSVDELLTLAGLVRWRDQSIDPRVFDTTLDDDAKDDLRRLITHLARRALPIRRRHGLIAPAPAYLALGTYLRHAYGEIAPEKVSGRAYPATLAAASGTLTEHLEQQGRVVHVDGHVVHLRLDDAWQGGGIWRSAIVDSESLNEVDLPMSLGWYAANTPASEIPTNRLTRKTPEENPPSATADKATAGETSAPVDHSEPVGQLGPAPPAEAGPVDASDPQRLPDAPAPDGGAEPEPTTVRTDATTCSWTFALTTRHHAKGTIPLTPLISEQMEGAGLLNRPAHVMLSHPGTDIAPDLLRQVALISGRIMTGFRWPDQMFIGLMLTASWIRDGSIVSLESAPLEEPKLCDGIPLEYKFDEEVVLRSWGAPRDLDVETGASVHPARVLAVLRAYARRVPSTNPLNLVLELHEVHRLCASQSTSPTTVEEVACAIDALTTRSTMRGSVLVQWACWTDATVDGDRYQHPRSTGSRAGSTPDQLAVLLSLAVKPSGAPSKAPPARQAMVAGALRRAHLRWTGGPISPERRQMVVDWALENGIDPGRIHPYQTFVRSARVRTYHRGGDRATHV